MSVFVCPVTDLTGASEWHDDCSTFSLLVMIEGPDLLVMVEDPGFSLLVDVAERLPCLVGLPVIGNAKRSCTWRIWPFVSMKVSTSANVSTH